MASAEQTAHFAALQWHLDQGMDEVLSDQPGALMQSTASAADAIAEVSPPSSQDSHRPARSQAVILPAAPLQGTPELRHEAIRLAAEAQTLDELRIALATFDGIAIRKTATNLVFCDGNPQAPIMLIGEAPGADEDRLGKPFVGVSGQLLDKILKCIDLDRTNADPARSIYISNILNWRPPGNRTPTPQEIELSLPFIERHIALAQPKLLIFCGGVSAKALLNTQDGISKLRGRWHAYVPQTPGLESAPIPAIATYHPSYLLRTPTQKKAVWQDMIILMEKLQELGISRKAA